MSWFCCGWKQAARLGRAGALLLASLACGAQTSGFQTSGFQTSGPEAEIRSAKRSPSADLPGGAVFAYLSAYLEERGVFAGPPGKMQSGPQSGFPIEDLVLPSPPPPRVVLRVTSCRWDALQHELQLYLRCSTPQACRPFLATIHPRNEILSAMLSAFAANQPAARNLGEGTGSKEKIPQAALLVKAGEHVRLLMAGPGVRIRLPVVCLERGVLGQRVRARAVGDAKIFLARVVGPGMLATEFQ